VRSLKISKLGAWVYILSALCRAASGGVIYNVTFDTTPLVDHPAGPFYLDLAFTDGSGVNDANNTVTLSTFNFGGGSALGGPFVFGGASGAIETGVTITDNTFLSLFEEPFVAGFQLSFTLDLTSNDDASGIPDRFTFFVLDSSGVPLPTLAPSGDYFFGADLHSTGPIFDAYGGDSSRAPSVGSPVSISAPTITLVNSVPEPSTLWLLAGGLATLVVLKYRFASLVSRLSWQRER